MNIIDLGQTADLRFRKKLGSSITASVTSFPGHAAGAGVLHEVTQAKVGNLDMVLGVQEKVFGFQITVNHLMTVCVRVCVCMHMCVCVCMHVCVYVHACMRTCVCIMLYVHAVQVHVHVWRCSSGIQN